MEQHNAPKTSSGFALWEWVKAICVVILTAIVAYKICVAPTIINIDFPTLLSLLLALFSVGLSALFYFKATDTSNTFYDNTYKFTKDIAELLVKIESGFGERLRHLDEGYSSMRNYLQSSPNRPPVDVEQTKEKLETERHEIEKVRAERDEIVKQLIERSQLQKTEKEQITAQLLAKEEELSHSQSEISKLNRRLTLERVMRRGSNDDVPDVPEGLSRFTYNNVIESIGVDRVMAASPMKLRQLFEEVAGKLPRAYLTDLEKHGFFTSRLTLLGIKYLKGIAEKFREE